MATQISCRRLVSVTGFGFFPLGFLARLPYAMAPLATLILIDDATGRPVSPPTHRTAPG